MERNVYRKKRRKKRMRKIRRRIGACVGIMVLLLAGALARTYLPVNSTEDKHELILISDKKEKSRTEDWELILVNRWNPIPDDYEVELKKLKNDQSVDSRIYPALQDMFDDARAEGILPAISESYRTAKKQQELMDGKIKEYQAEGYSKEEAKELAEEWVAIPGTSEHQIGIAVDITSADKMQQNPSVVWKWMDENSYKYGFVRRYPEDKTEITGVINEPWHYRYVGKEAAEKMHAQDVCLEEYLGQTEH